MQLRETRLVLTLKIPRSLFLSALVNLTSLLDQHSHPGLVSESNTIVNQDLRASTGMAFGT